MIRKYLETIIRSYSKKGDIEKKQKKYLFADSSK